MFPYVTHTIQRITNFTIRLQDKIAIYGTGAGAKLVCNILKEMGRDNQIECFIDQDSSDKIGNVEFGRKICRLKDCYRDIDIIIIGAYGSHVVIRERLESFCCENINREPLKTPPHFHAGMA